MHWFLVLIGVAACGRIHFEQRGDDGGADSASGDSTGDSTMLAPWSVVQTAEALGGPTPLAPTGSGNLIVVAEQLKDSDAVISITDNAPGGSNTYIAIPATHSIEASSSTGVEIWFATSSRPGATSIVVSTGLPANSTVVWEVSWLPTIVVDGASAIDDQPMTTTPLGPMVITTVDGAFVVSVAIVKANVTGIHAGNEFTNDRTANANGWAHLTSPSAPAGPHQAQWDQGAAGVYCASTAAFRVGP